jgi:hypothetical protein
VKQYEKLSPILRNEICSNNLSDLGLKKGLERLAAARQKFLAVADRFGAFQAERLNVRADFPLRIAPQSSCLLYPTENTYPVRAEPASAPRENLLVRETSAWRVGLLLLRHVTPPTRRHVVYFCSGAYTGSAALRSAASSPA